MRTMWNEFPDDEAVYDISSQFMLGTSLLIAPKLKWPSALLEKFGLSEVDYYLPSGYDWYGYRSGLKIPSNETGFWHTNIKYSTYDQAVFAKGGSIIPALSHEDCQAIDECINNPITLHVFCTDDQQAWGTVYFDDGHTYNYTMKDGSAELSFEFDGSKLTSTNVSDNNY